VAEQTDTGDDSEEEIPKLPRAPLFGKPSLHSVVRVGMLATVLYAIVVMRRPCAEGVGRFIGGFDDAADAAPVDRLDHYPGYELMTAEEALKRWPDSPTHDGGIPDAPSSASTMDTGTAGTTDAAAE
jgi:hypothetical protein